MNGNAHLAMGIFVGTFMVLAARPEPIEGAIVLGSTALASITPDIDSRYSKISSRLPIASAVISSLFGHRKLFHSPLMLCFLWFTLNSTSAGRGFVAGYGVHLIQDLFTSGGIPLFYPLKKKFSFSPFRSGGITDWIITVILMVLISLVFGKGVIR